MYDFLTDLDGYFCEKYANYDKLCILPGYNMPIMQRSEVREDGRTYAYTLPADTMSLAKQEKKAELLAELKKRMVDITFSFSFIPNSIFRRIANLFRKETQQKALLRLLEKYGVTPQEALEGVTVSNEIWTGICKGKFDMTKNLIFSLALTLHFSFDDTVFLLECCGYVLDYSIVKDVVIAYLLTSKVYNSDMVEAALAEYKVDNLFIK